MKTISVTYLEPGDKIYIMDKYDVIEVTLTEKHIKNRSTTDPSFLVATLRLKSAKVTNGQVMLEKGNFYDKSIGMSVDYGYNFTKSDIKAFISQEALEQYRNESSKKSKLLKASVKQLRDDIRPHIDAILQLVEEQSAYAKSIGATEEELSQMDGYRFIEELCEYVG